MSWDLEVGIHKPLIFDAAELGEKALRCLKTLLNLPEDFRLDSHIERSADTDGGWRIVDEITWVGEPLYSFGWKLPSWNGIFLLYDSNESGKSSIEAPFVFIITDIKGQDYIKQVLAICLAIAACELSGSDDFIDSGGQIIWNTNDDTVRVDEVMALALTERLPPTVAAEKFFNGLPGQISWREHWKKSNYDLRVGNKRGDEV